MAKSGDQQQQQQTQSSKTDPWSPAQPLLQKLLDQYGGLSTDVTGGQSGAIGNIIAGANEVPNFGGTGADAINKLFSSSTAPQVGMLSSSLDQLKSNIGGTASGANLDPYKTPGFSDAISTMTNDITNRVKGVYNASGRDPSGAGSFAKSLGRGLTEGISPTIAAEAARLRGEQHGAAGTLYNAGNTTAGAITGQQQVPLSNAVQALNSAGLLSSLFTQPGTTQLQAANTAYQQPYGNLAALLAPAAQIGGLGGSTSGQSNTTVTQSQNPLSNIIGGASAGIGLLSFLSDERAKENIEEVGELHDGQPVYRYNYKGDPGGIHIGLLAQDVLEVEPEAVDDFGDTGLLAVNYKRATDRAATMRRAA